MQFHRLDWDFHSLPSGGYEQIWYYYSLKLRRNQHYKILQLWIPLAEYYFPTAKHEEVHEPIQLQTQFLEVQIIKTIDREMQMCFQHLPG